jgi:hypothetical protein
MGYHKSLFLIINGIIGVLCLIGVYYTFLSMQVELDPISHQPVTDTAAVDTSMTFSIWFSIGSLVLITAFTIWAIMNNPKRFIPSFIGLAVFVIVIFVGYAMTTIETTGPITELDYATPGWIKWSGVGIETTYVLIFLAAALIVAQLIRQMLGFFSK